MHSHPFQNSMISVEFSCLPMLLTGPVPSQQPSTPHSLFYIKSFYKTQAENYLKFT
ncbi:hypothetical protein NERG_00492 [Nematocida ausubeli]|uniref:Uncharacterized protein n=1 Tax=Nematocida ausubeli (strain ATCC PRA-371 / ERTm2) TaxID=1913371 RepID=H8ZA71_NEMA1|nr:hypothetical protein NERG_00492 [Nematocida ausubeli]